MAIDTLGANALATDSVTAAKIADDAVVAADIADGSVTTVKLADNAVTSAKALNLGRRNVIINGAMQVAQRATSVTGLTSSGYTSVDRFRLSLGSAGTWTMAQVAVTDLPGFRTSLKMDCTSADASLAATDDIAIQQRFEGQNLQHFKKGTASATEWALSFYVKGTTTGTYICELFDNDNSRHVNKSYTINSANTWEYKTIIFPADTTGVLNNSNGHNFRVAWYLAAGSNFTSGTLQTTWGSNTAANKAVGQVNLAANTANDWQITGVQLEPGSVSTDFEHRSYAEELVSCQRYFETSNPDITGNATTDRLAYCNYTVYTASSGYVDYFYDVQKRAIPTISHGASIWRIYQNGSLIANANGAGGTDGIGHKNFALTISGPTFTTNSGGMADYRGHHAVKIDAEL